MPDEQAKENKVVIKENIKIISDELKDKKAEELAKAETITEEQAKELIKKQKTEQLTKEEQIKLDKFFFKKAYNYNEDPTDKRIYRIYEDKKTKRNYKNLSGFYKDGFSFDDGLEAVREHDYYKIYNKLSIDEDQVITDKHGDLIIKTTGIKTEYSKQKIVVDIYKKLGFETFHDRREIDRAEMIKNLKTIHEEHLTNPQELIITLKKERRKAQAIADLKPESKTFINHMLKFINGLTGDLYGIKVIATDTNRTAYKLETPIDTLFLRVKNNNFIPVLGNPQEPAEPPLYEQYEQFEQMALAKQRA